MVKRQLPEDFKDFIQLLNINDVKYLLVGGWAVAAHGHPRATKDIDFLVSDKKISSGRIQDIADAEKLKKFLMD